MLLRGPVRSEHCHDQPGRSAERESTDRSPSSPVKDCNQIFTAIVCRDPQKKRRGTEQQTLPSNAKKRAQILFRGHLSAFVRVLNPVPQILTRTRIMAENLSLSPMYVQLHVSWRGSYVHGRQSAGSACIHIYAHMYRHTFMHIHTVCFIYTGVK